MEPKDSLIEYPSRFPIKVMGAQVEGFVEAIAHVARQFDPDLMPPPSSSGPPRAATTLV
jgi:putative lipoic acid-binding regulatory protein